MYFLYSPAFCFILFSIICQPGTLPLYYFASLTPFLCIIPPAGTLCVFYFASVALSLCLAPRVERPSASFPPFLGVRACVLLSQGVINLWGAPCRTLLYAVRFAALYSTARMAVHGNRFPAILCAYRSTQYNRRVVRRPAT